MRYKILLFFFLLLTTAFAQEEQHVYSFTSYKEAERFQDLTKEIRCVVCQNQSIADSNAPLANDLRDKIYHMILEKKSDKEIKTYLSDRYGEFILLKPRFNKLTMVLWLFPFLALLFALWLVLRWRINTSPI